MAPLCADLGFGGIDLTLREGGHVLPERVADDLPKAAEEIRKAGLRLSMVTTSIAGVKTPHAEAMVKTMSSLGIRRYRWGGLRYVANRSIPEQLDEFRPVVKDLTALNRQYNVCAMYHTHSGVAQVGASFWDLYLLLKETDPNFVSANFDIGHATVEGGFGGWIHSARLLLPYTRGIAVKDFKWIQDARGRWVPGWCGLGQGMVNVSEFLRMAKAAGFSGPFQLHMEYPELGTASTGGTTSSLPKDQFVALMKRDLTLFQKQMRDAGFAV